MPGKAALAMHDVLKRRDELRGIYQTHSTAEAGSKQVPATLTLFIDVFTGHRVQTNKIQCSRTASLNN